MPPSPGLSVASLRGTVLVLASSTPTLEHATPATGSAAESRACVLALPFAVSGPSACNVTYLPLASSLVAARQYGGCASGLTAELLPVWSHGDQSCAWNDELVWWNDGVPNIVNENENDTLVEDKLVTAPFLLLLLPSAAAAASNDDDERCYTAVRETITS